MRITTGSSYWIKCMDNYLLDLLICNVPGLRGEDKIALAEIYTRAYDFLILTKADIEYILGRKMKCRPWSMADVCKKAETDAELALKRGIHMVSWREKSYPPLLREIFDPPLLLFYRGALPDPEKPIAAIVGTRKPTPQCAERAFTLGRELGEAGIPVVSGLALGIDAMAHRGNIEGRAATIAVLGSGVDMVFPSSNRELARAILNKGGALLSEYPPGTGPDKWHFPARNRIISALARGVVIVEAPLKSGALITAQFALDQNRDLWVDAEGAKSKRGEGSARLAEEGAKLIFSAGDILAEWNIEKNVKILKRKGKREDAEQNSGAALASSMADYLDINL